MERTSKRKIAAVVICFIISIGASIICFISSYEEGPGIEKSEKNKNEEASTNYNIEIGLDKQWLLLSCMFGIIAAISPLPYMIGIMQNAEIEKPKKK